MGHRGTVGRNEGIKQTWGGKRKSIKLRLRKIKKMRDHIRGYGSVKDRRK